MKSIFALLTFIVLAASTASAADNPFFADLIEKGVTMSDGSNVKLPQPFLADGLTAAEQQAILAKLCESTRASLDEVTRKASTAPIVMRVRTIKPGEDEAPSIRAVDVWFVVHGNWDILNSKKFLESIAQRDDEGKSSIVTKSGILTDAEIADRKSLKLDADLAPTKNAPALDQEMRFVYTTFSLFDRVEISATRFALVTRNKESVLAAAKIDPRFNDDKEYPNQWRLLLRNDVAEIEPGPPHPYAHAGGYAKITRLREPSDAFVMECHLVFEEPYAWFDGANLVKQKTPAMVQEKVRSFRRKLILAGEKKE